MDTITRRYSRSRLVHVNKLEAPKPPLIGSYGLMIAALVLLAGIVGHLEATDESQMKEVPFDVVHQSDRAPVASPLAVSDDPDDIQPAMGLYGYQDAQQTYEVQGQ